MNRLLRFNNAAESGSRTGPLWLASPEFGECWRHAEHCSRAHGTILDTKQHAKVGVANVGTTLFVGYSITSSAIWCRCTDTVRPSALAVLRLMTSSNISWPLVTDRALSR